MIEINNVKIFTDNIEPTALHQVMNIAKSGIFNSASPIRVMPDVHSGAGCVIGFTAYLGDKIIPNIVGVDIGCGMLTVELGQNKPDLELLDKIIYTCVPSGKNAHTNIAAKQYQMIKELYIDNLYCKDKLKNIDHIICSLGTLGGGNHFIEVDKDEGDNYYLIIHSGSRNLGKQVADIYQEIAIDNCNDISKEVAATVAQLKAEGRFTEIESTIKNMRQNAPNTPKDLCYLTGIDAQKYLHDMRICQRYAEHNRKLIANIITTQLTNRILDQFYWFETIHNYIGIDNIIRKGAIAAYEGQRLLIPLNMRDGCILGVGKGNREWNYSAPHGAGRIMSRAAAKQTISLEEYKNSMEGIYTTTVNEHTLDEAPQTYKPSQEIVDLVKDTIIIRNLLKPIYNFKANE